MANNIVKTPYEISVWEDKLYYQKITTWFEAVESQQEGTQYYEATHAAAEYDPDARYYKLENGKYIYTVPPASTSTYVNYYLISPATSSTQTFLALQHAEEEYDTDSAASLNDNDQVISSFVEVPLAVIGSDTMDTPIRAHQPHLNCNINGTKTLTFLMYYRYYDYDVGDYMENPFIKLMVNERKIKLHYKNEWYDFIIKNIEESTDSTSITYVCQDQFITELGKTGFQLEFDTDLSNNTGTIEELGAAILDGTDWKLGDSDLLPQRTQEPLYVLSIASGTTLQCKYTRFENNEAVDYDATISGPTVIYTYYTPIIDQNPRVQFLYLPSGVEPKINDGILENSEQYYIDGVTYNASGIPNFAVNTVLTPAEFQGKRLVRSYETLYDPKSQHTVSIYDNDWSGDPAVLYEYESYQYKAPVILENRLANTTLFENTSGWQSYGTNELSIVSDPPVTESIDPNAKIYLSYTINDDNTALRNDGLFAKPFTPGIMEGTTYVLRIKTPQRNTNLTARIVDYTDSQDSSTHLIEPDFGDTTYLLFTHPVRRHLGGDGRYYLALENGNIYLPQDDEDDDAFYIATAANTLSYSEMRAKLAAFFLEGSVGNTYLIQGIELYEYLTEEVIDEHNRHYNTLMTPNTQDLKGKVTTIYNYYDPTTQPEIVSDPAEIKYYYSDTTPLSGYTQRYRANYEKVRSITARESNRLNLIQSCCETFECWADFRIAHNESDGRLITELIPYIDVDGYVKYRVRADKTVTFKEFIGTDNYRGFRYGINLNSISRTIDSDAIVTKMIVSMNSNEHAENGFCTIARAPSNLTGEDFLISFDYYIHQGLLNGTQVYNDLYTKGPITMGYYSGLADINKSNKPLIEEQNDLVSRVIPRAQADLTMYTEARTAAANSKQDWVNLIEGKGCTREEYETIIAIPPQNRTANERQTVQWAKSYYIKIITFEQQFDYYNTLAEAAEARYNEYTARLDEIQDLLDKNVIRKQELNQDFYTKYSRFIQEGSWIDEDYVEDELYYLDALSVLTTSNQPEVNYNINVLELSELEGYENYTYKLGDKSYIEDTELFGYVTISGLRTPYQEEIIISETDDYFDEPENNTFKVQNYKTQFEDLFQRIAAETTNIQYASGSYNRAASAVNTDGTFNVAALQSTLNDSSLILSNLRDQSVVWDENGITITSDAYPLQIVRLVSRGIVLSNDGGQTWTVGISGSGINTAALSAGAIDTSLIVLRSGADPSFRWDSYGITAYDFSGVEETNTYDWSKFVRFDRFGLYGYDGHLLDTDFHPTSEADITGEEDVKFSLTWSGFRLRTNNGAVTITSDNDIQVFGPNTTERIKIGELSNNVYGLRISDATGAAVMETNSNGDLWLRKRLNISSSGNYNIGVGYLDGYKTVNQTQVHEVFNANNLFKVYEDGSMEATNGSFQGYINATGGQIGNLTINYNDEDHGTIADLVEGVQNFHIESVNGFIFTQQDGTISPTTLTLNAAGLSSADLAHTTWEVWNTPTRINPENKVWEYNLNGSHEAASIVLSFSTLNIEHGFVNNNILYLFAICGSHVARQSLNYITATAEVDQYQVVITSSAGTDISARDAQTALTAQVFLNGAECTADYDNFTYVWTRDSGNINEDTVYNYQLSGSNTRTLLTFNSVNAIYYCKVYLQNELLNIGEISLVSQANEDELYLSLSQDEVLIYYDENKQLTTSPNIITLVMQRYGDLTDNLTMASMQIQAAGQSIKRWINPKINVQYLVNNNPIKTYVDVYEYLHALGDIGGYTITDENLRQFAPGVTYYTYDYDDATGYGYTPVTSAYNEAQVYYTNQGDIEFLKWVIIDGDFTPTADQSPISQKPYFTIEPKRIDFSGDPPTWETSRTITVGAQNIQLPIKYYRRYRLNGADVYSRDITGSFYNTNEVNSRMFTPVNSSITIGESGGYLDVTSIVGNNTGLTYTTSATPQPGVSFTLNNWPQASAGQTDDAVIITYFDYDYYKDVEEQASTYTNFPDGYYDIIFQAKSIDFFVKQLFEFMPNHIEEVYSNPNWAHTSDNLTSWSDIFKTFEQLKFHGIYTPADDSLNPSFASGKTYYLAGRDGIFYTVTSVDGNNARPYTDKTYYIKSTTLTTNTYIGDDVTTTFNLYSRLADESSLIVTVNDTTISNFTINNNSVILNTPPAAHDTINIRYIYWTQDELDWPYGDTNEYYYYNTRDQKFIKAGAKRVRTMQYYTFQPLSLESLTFLLELFNPEGDPYNVVNNNIQVAPKGTTVIPIRYGLNSDALEFQINAYNISAAIQNSKLLFDADGLHVYNGGFDIYNNAGDRVLYADTDGNLTLAGTIEATAGHIGGFTITDTTLAKGDLFVLDTNNLMLRLGNVGTGIIIDSNFDNGLYTSSLSIGQNLILTSKSSPSNSTIDTYPIFDFAPNSVSTLVLNSDGSVEGRNWSVSAEGHASFNDATVSGTVTGSNIVGSIIEGNDISGGVIRGSEIDGGVINAGILNAVEINTATFNTKEVRSMGGTFIFRPTAKPIRYSVARPISYGTFTGPVISVNDDVGDLAITSLVADIEPVQDLHGYDNPWPAGGGKNKFYPNVVAKETAIDKSGVTYTAHQDGTISAVGTATSNNQYLALGNVTLPAGDYIISGAPDGYSDANKQSVRVRLNSYSGTAIGLTYQNGGAFSLTEETTVYVTIYTQTGAGAVNNVFKPMICLSSASNPTVFAPYSNICPITGWTGCNVTRTGKNLVNLLEIGTFSESKPAGSTYESMKSAYTTRLRSSTLIPIYGKQITVSWSDYSNYGVCFTYFDSKGLYLGQSAGFQSWRYDITTINNPAVYYIACAVRRSDNGTMTESDISALHLQVEFGSTATSYEEYQGETVTVDWSTEAGTVCGGTFNVITGVLTVTHILWAANTSTMNNSEAYPGWKNTGISDWIGYGFNGKKDNQILNIGNNYNANTTGTSTGTIFLSTSTYGKTQSEWKALAQDVQIVIELATPQTYSLTPQQINTILGTNNIWTDIGNIKVDANNSTQTITFDLPDDSFVDVSKEGEILRVNSYYGIIKQRTFAFTKTTDTVVDDEKTYYYFDSQTKTYHEVEEPSGDPSQNDYYEATQPSISAAFKTTASLNLDSITSFLNLGVEQTTPIISISSEGYTADGLIAGSGLSMTNVTLQDDIQQPQVVSHLFLGDFSTFKDQSIHPELPQEGYGLVADNVFLRGSLTTQHTTQQGSSYSGINTISTIKFKHDEIPNQPENDYIIFWGGATDTTEDAIKNAPFQVSNHGNFYASSGLFQGSIISNATITGSTLEAAVIKGGDTAALRIYDTGVAGGIQFMKKVGSIDGSGVIEAPANTDIITLGIDSTGLYTGQQASIEYFIKVDPTLHTAVYNGIFNSPNDINNHIQVNNTGVAYYIMNEGHPKLKTSLILAEKNIKLQGNSSQYIMVDSNSNILNNAVNQLNNEIIYQTVITSGNNDTFYRLNYKPNTNNSDNYGGYNLIVT